MVGDRGARGLGHGVLAVAARVPPKAHGQDVDEPVQGAKVHSGDDGAFGGTAARIQHLDADDISLPRGPHDRLAQVCALTAGGNARCMGAVAVVVIGGQLQVNRVEPVDDIAAGEHLVTDIYAGVEHANHHPLSGRREPVIVDD